jgi:uncharacterized repeat protein (TIGR03806 family)
MLEKESALRTVLVACVLALVAGCDRSSSDDPPPVQNPPQNPPPNPPPPSPPTAGLDQRPDNFTCVAPAKANPNAGATIELERVFAGLGVLTQPLAMLQAPGDDSRWFVLEKTGRVRVFANSPGVSAFDTDFINLTVNADSEGGLLGMAFHPDFAQNRQVFLSWTEGSPMVSVIARFTSQDNGLTLAPARVDVIRVNQPNTNHNGGQIAFGPDGFLYIGFGDGGGSGDPNSTAQDTTDLLGAFLRIDVDGAAPYSIPSDNPFAGGPLCGPAHGTSGGDCPEIFASGLRNPWRWSFDTATGDLWVGDVGQGSFEEVNRVQLGGNYGWDCREGASAYTGPPDAPSPQCSAASGLSDPVHQYGRTQGASITGGYVYRGAALPALVGRYLFADYITGKIWALPAGGGTVQELLDTSSLSIASFGQGNDGELYIVDIAGTLHKIVDGGGSPPPGPPVATLLSATGCVNAQSPSEPASGLIPYDVAAPFWSDAAVKERWLAIPNGTTIGVAADGDFELPNGAVLMKHFRLNDELIETRLFMRHPDGDWAGYTYEWNAGRTDATLVQGGKAVTIGQQSWIFPSGNDCLQCHTSAAGFALGLEAAQLNHDFTYAATGRTANQLETLDQIVMFDSPLGDPSLQPALADPGDFNAPLDEAARAYLHTNCAQCHRPGGVAQSSMDLRFSTALNAMAACDAAPQLGDLGLPNARLIAPGAPDSSVLLARMNRRDAQGMPPVASTVIDAEGGGLLRNWIESLTGCQ